MTALPRLFSKMSTAGQGRAKPLVFLFVAGLLVKVGYVLLWPDLTPANDLLNVYEPLARNILAGHGFSVRAGQPTVLQPPLFPLFLSGVYYIFGESHLAARLLLALCDALSPLVLWSIARRVFDNRVAFWTALALAFYPLSFFLVGSMLAEPLFIPLYLGFLLLLLRGREEGKLKHYFLAGALLGLATLTRSVSLWLPIFLGIGLVLFSKLTPWRTRSQSQGIGLLLLGMVIVIAPWTARNYAVTGSFVPVEARSAMSLYGSTLPELEGTGGDEKYVAYEKKVAEIVPPGASEMEESRILAREGIRRIVAHPLGYVRLAMVKAVRFWYGSDSGRYELFLALMQFPILAMGLLGAGIAIARGRGNRTLPFLLVIVYFWTIHAIALAFARYSVPIMPLVIMLAVYGVIELWHMVSQRQEREEALSPTL